MFGALGVIGAVIALFILAVIGFAIYLVVARTWIKVAGADEALIVSAKNDNSPPTIVVHGKAWVMPARQTYERISLRSRQVNMEVSAQSKDGVSLNVGAVALIKIGSEPEMIQAASERFGSQDKAIEPFTEQQLTGILRGVVARQTVTSLMQDREQFSREIAESVEIELDRQGLILDSFQINDITDSAGYIDSLGVPEIQARRREAELATSDAERAIAQRRITNEEENLTEQTKLDINAAKASSETGRERAEAEQAEALAREKSRQQVLEQQTKNRSVQLEAEVNSEADAELYRRQKAAEAEAYEQARQAQTRKEVAELEAAATIEQAKADAESERLRGQARADAIAAEGEALEKNQQALLAQRAFDVLPTLMTSFAEGYGNIGSMTVISGSGEDSGMGNHFAGEQAAGMKAVIHTVKEATGVDLADIINGQATGRATGGAIGQALRETDRGAAQNTESAQDTNDADFAAEDFGTTRFDGHHDL